MPPISCNKRRSSSYLRRVAFYVNFCKKKKENNFLYQWLNHLSALVSTSHYHKSAPVANQCSHEYRKPRVNIDGGQNFRLCSKFKSKGKYDIIVSWRSFYEIQYRRCRRRCNTKQFTNKAVKGSQVWVKRQATGKCTWDNWYVQFFFMRINM